MCVDMAANEAADVNVLVEANDLWTEQAEKVIEAVGAQLDGNKLDAVLCVAGGWAGGNAANKGNNCLLYTHYLCSQDRSPPVLLPRL